MLMPMAICPECGGGINPDITNAERNGIDQSKWFLMSKRAQVTGFITLWCRNKGFCSIADAEARIDIKLPKWKATLIIPAVPAVPQEKVATT